MILTDELAESLLRTVKNSAYKVMLTPEDYRHRAQVMWAGSLSHNGLGRGRSGDSAPVEEECAAFHRQRHGAVHDSGPGCVCLRHKRGQTAYNETTA